MPITIRQPDALTYWIPVRVSPKGSINAVLPFRVVDEWVQLKVTVAPEGGKANKAVLLLLAKGLGVRKSRLTLVKGKASRFKVVSFKGFESDDMLCCLVVLAKVMQTTTQEAFRLG